MTIPWTRIAQKLRWWVNRNRPKKSYSQCGEDLIMDSMFGSLGIKRPSYMDIGAYDPYEISNTYLFYRRGSRGVCIEPNPVRFRRIQRARRGDTCFNMGVGPETKAAMDFFIMSQETLSTFSAEEARRVATYGRNRIKKTLQIPVIALPDLIAKHHLQAPDFLSIDLEGSELAVLQTLDLKTWRPKAFCVETLTYTEDKTEKKQLDTIQWIKDQNYMLYADTYINSIFVDRAFWDQR